jgi:outer membrane biosynthesis protein TonB
LLSSRRPRRVSVDSVNTSLLAQELEPLNAQIEQVQGKLEVLEGELRLAEAELETFSAEQQRFDALRDVCNALDKLGEMEAVELFWEGMPDIRDAAGHVERLRDRIARFEEKTRGVQEKKESLQEKVNTHLDDLDYLYEEVRDAYAREERRKEEFVVEREISSVPYRMMIMPWSKEDESERRFRRALCLALLLCIVFGSLFSVMNLPVRERSVVVEIPERLAMLVKKEPPKPEPVPERPQEEKKPEPEPEKPQERKVEEKPKKPEPAPVETQTARKKAENTGVLAFKSTFADLIDETPIARLGTQSKLTNEPSPGQAVAQRSLVSMQAQGSSGGISSAAVSRNVGSGNADRLGSGVGFARVESSVAGLAEESRPLSDGPGPARTDEEIQIVFDRYKATLYRIYNTELRRDPTLRGKMLLRITIEPGGEVSACRVESTDLASPELVAQIVDRVRRFNFGPKDDVPKITILYPIDFLPAG